MKNTNNNGEFHLKWVKIIKFVWRSEPFWIETEWIYTTLLFWGVFFMVSFTITAAKNVQWKSEEFVINPSSVEWEHSHHEEQISYFMNVRKHFLSTLTSQQPDTESQNYTTMSNITKHDTKQEWENWNCIKCWVYFLISWDTISVDNFLEWSCKCICFNMGWILCLWFHLS